MAKIDLHKENIQGLIIRGYTHPCSSHLLFSFPAAEKGKGAAAAFFKVLMPYVQPASVWIVKPKMMLNIGLTYSGIQKACAFSADELGTFEPSFKEGPASEDSQRALADIDDADPSRWLFGSGPGNNVDVVVHVYAMTETDLAAITGIVTGAAAAANVKELLPFDGKERLTQYPLETDRIHFGYKDGISEPDLNWPENTDPGDLNNFIIGYPNSSIEPGPFNEAVYKKFSAFMKDGCYNAFRVVYQDVEAFEKFLDDNAKDIAAALGKPSETAYAREWLAAKLCGRWRNGSPLNLSPDAPDPETADATVFEYVTGDAKTDDTAGMRCPFSGHTRVANPRDDKKMKIQDHRGRRIIRRGVPYGAPFGAADYKNEQGLIGLFLCGSISAQFELVSSWMNSNDFSKTYFPDYDTQDALLGNRQAGNNNTFRIPIPGREEPLALKHTLPKLIVARGTLYCLLPSVSALQSIADGSVAEL
ncbi:MAG: peroxidase [Bacteroidetes bacterium]|nr:peroxidase [Bacteroidota bacterium]